MAEETSLRAFLALDLPLPIRREIGTIQNRLKKILRGDIRWTNPEGMHLTLKFFGSILSGRVAAISEVAGDIAARMTPLDLHVEALGAFPGTERPRVIWLGVGGDVASLVRLQKELDRGLTVRGFPQEERPFHPHLTLGRVRPGARVAGLAEIAARERDTTAGSFTPDGLVLVKSDLTPRGAVYTELAKFPWGGC